ncbi:unnamed protein product, partial [Symbiodinium necroappetens]
VEDAPAQPVTVADVERRSSPLARLLRRAKDDKPAEAKPAAPADDAKPAVDELAQDKPAEDAKPAAEASSSAKPPVDELPQDKPDEAAVPETQEESQTDVEIVEGLSVRRVEGDWLELAARTLDEYAE